MRKLLTGTDSAGRSYIANATEIVFESLSIGSKVTGVSSAALFSTEEFLPPMHSAERGGSHDLHVPPGAIAWRMFRFAPGYSSLMHHTDTIDLDVVLEGSVEILLDDGEHLLESGDCVIVTGVDHAWRAGPDGVVMNVTLIGTPPRV